MFRSPHTAGRTLDLMLRLHPDARHVAVVSGNGPRDRQYAEVFRGVLSPFENRVDFTWLTNLSMKDLRGKLSRLPDHTLVLYLTMFQDAAGETFSPRQALDTFAPASRAPIYGYYETYIGHGIVGGWMVTFEEIGRNAAQLSLRVLAGEDPHAAARSQSYHPVAMFDWRQLQRWKISEQRLPPGSVVRFKETTYWEQHQRIILAALSLCLLEALLIVALLAQLRRRRLAEASVRENEQRMSLAVEAANFGIWIRDLARNEIWASDKWRELFGFTPSERIELERIFQKLHPDDREALQGVFTKALTGGSGYETEFRLMLPDGGIRWISSQGRVECNGNGEPVRLRGASRDVTAHKQAEQETLLLRQEIAHVSRVSMMGQLASASGARDQSAARGDPAQCRGGRAFHAERIAGPRRNPRHPCRYSQGRPACGQRHRPDAGLLKRHNLDTRPLHVDELVSDVGALVRADAVARHVKFDSGGAPRSAAREWRPRASPTGAA